MIKNKKGVELTWETIVVFIIIIVVFIVVVIFFVKHYGANSAGLMNVSKDAISGISTN